jgi:hypothetical protein
MSAQELTLFDVTGFSDGWRTCPRCVSLGYPGRYPDAFFRKLYGKKVKGRSWLHRSKFCEGCEDEINEDSSLRKSLSQRICDHAKRRGMPVKEYRAKYNLSNAVVLAWYKAKIRSGLLDCGCLVSEMKHGSKDIEMHQTNPAEPFFPDCWKLVCTNDHRGMHHEDHAARKRGWQLWKEARGR